MQYMYFVCIKIGFITFTRKYVLRDVCCMKEPWSDTSGQLTWGYTEVQIAMDAYKETCA